MRVRDREIEKDTMAFRRALFLTILVWAPVAIAFMTYSYPIPALHLGELYAMKFRRHPCSRHWIGQRFARSGRVELRGAISMKSDTSQASKGAKQADKSKPPSRYKYFCEVFIHSRVPLSEPQSSLYDVCFLFA